MDYYDVTRREDQMRIITLVKDFIEKIKEEHQV
jgi:hypothetical protein